MPGNLFALFLGYRFAGLLWHLAALLLGYIDTVLSWHLCALLAWYISALLLGNIDALLAGDGLALLCCDVGTGVLLGRLTRCHWECEADGFVAVLTGGDREVYTGVLGHWLADLFGNISWCDSTVGVKVGEADLLELISACCPGNCKTLLLWYRSAFASCLLLALFVGFGLGNCDTFSRWGCSTLLYRDLDTLFAGDRFATLLGDIFTDLLLLFLTVVSITRLRFIVARLLIHGGTFLFINILAVFFVLG